MQRHDRSVLVSKISCVSPALLCSLLRNQRTAQRHLEVQSRWQRQCEGSGTRCFQQWLWATCQAMPASECSHASVDKSGVRQDVSETEMKSSWRCNATQVFLSNLFRNDEMSNVNKAAVAASDKDSFEAELLWLVLT